MPDSPKADIGPGAIRTAVVWDAVREVVAGLGADRALTIVDLGGGTGGLAVRIAGLGHEVTVIDPSPNALASLHRRAADEGVEALVEAVQGDAGDLGRYAPDGSVDLLLCHGVLDVMEDPDPALDGIRTALRPGGCVSVVVLGRPAGVVARALSGQFDRARALLDARPASWRLEEHGPRRFTGPEVEDLLSRHGLELERVDAVRVFSDLVPSALVDGEPGARRALLELERAVAQRPEFAAVAGQLHVVARRR